LKGCVHGTVEQKYAGHLHDGGRNKTGSVRSVRNSRS